VTFDLESRSKVNGSSRNVPLFPNVEEWRDRTHSEWFSNRESNCKLNVSKFLHIIFSVGPLVFHQVFGLGR